MAFGLSFGGGSSKSSTNQQQTSQGSSTTKPILSPELQGLYDQFIGKVGGLFDMDPSSLVAGPSGNQQAAFDKAAGMFAPGGSSAIANDMFGAAGQLAAAGATGQVGPITAPTMQPTATAGMPTMGPVALAGATGAGAGSAQGATARAGQLGQASTYDAAQTGILTPEELSATVGPMAQAETGNLLGIDLSGYMDPYLNDVVAATKADVLAQAAQAKAAGRAEMSGTGAIRGSGRAVREGIMQGEVSRALATKLGELRAEGRKQALDYATKDLDRDADTERLNTTEKNKGILTQAELDQAGKLKQVDVKMSDTAAENQAREFGAGAQNDRNLTQGKLDTDASIASARNLTDASIASLDAQTRASIAAADNATKVALANASSLNEREALLASIGVDVGKFNADQINTMAREAAGMEFDAEKFNAGLESEALNRLLQGSSLFGDLGSTIGSSGRADIATLLEAGAAERGISQEELLADPAFLDMLGGLFSTLNPLIGQQTDESGTSTLVGTTKGKNNNWGVGLSFGKKGG